MKKPDRKAFTREFGPRGAAKYAKAMQKYRKSLKTKPTAPPPAPGKTKGIGPIKDGAKYARQVANSKTKTTGVGPVKSGAEYGRALTKGKSEPMPKSARAVDKKPAPTKAQTERFYSSSSQGSIAKNQEKAKQNFFRSSSGTRGQNMSSNPKLKSKPKRSNYPAGRSGEAAYKAALRNYNKKPAKPRRASLTMAQRRRARRSSR